MIKSSRRSTPTTALQKWLVDLTEETLSPDDLYSGQTEGLALVHRPAMQQLLSDPEVQSAIDRVCERDDAQIPLADKLDTIKTMLVTACWRKRFFAPKDQSIKSASTAGNKSTRTEKIRELTRAAEKAQELAQMLEDLTYLTGGTLSVSHLTDRVAAGDAEWFIKRRKGGYPGIRPADRSLVDLLLALTSDLVEEAALIKMTISETPQPGRKSHRLSSLMDTLSRQSIKLGGLSQRGLPQPDFKLVNAILTSVMPDEAPDESTLEKRWRRQGQRKQKSA